jgi:hypothetical protein
MPLSHLLPKLQSSLHLCGFCGHCNCQNLSRSTSLYHSRFVFCKCSVYVCERMNRLANNIDRIVVLTGFRIWSFDSSAFKTNPTLGGATYIVFTQAELTYSLLASTFPSTRRFVVDLVTYYNNGQFVGKDHYRGRDDPMGKDIQMMTLESKATMADHQPGGTNSGNDGDDSSQTGIIKKTVSYDVVSERASVHAGRSDGYEIPYFGI